jgi:hypothetical protein
MCGVEAEVSVAAGFAVRLYPVDPRTLQVSAKWIRATMTEDTAAIIVTHYFGFPSDVASEIGENNASADVFLIEDCAHALGSRYAGRALGTFGTLAFFSLRKSIPLPHGGALVVNDPEVPLPEVKQPSGAAVNFDALVYFYQQCGLSAPLTTIDEIYKTLGRQVDRFGARLPEDGGYELGLSLLAQVLIQSIDVQSHLSARRTLFRRYGDYFRQRRPALVRALYLECPDDVSPPFFPLVFALGSKRGYDMVAAKGYHAPIPFWSLVQDRPGSPYPEVARLREQLMVLPLIDPLTEADLDGAIRVLEESS